jgi:hypothetical protein
VSPSQKKDIARILAAQAKVRVSEVRQSRWWRLQLLLRRVFGRA